MDKDIAPELIDKVNNDFESNLSADKKATNLAEKLAAGQAKYEDAYKYAESVGNARAKAFGQISSDVLPEGKMHYNIASRLIEDTLTTDHDMVADYAAGVQKIYNEKAGISLKALKADVDQDRIKGFVEGVCNAELFDDVAWKLGEPVVTHARSVVDDTIKKNAEFQHKAGITATVKRKAAPRCCEWCTDLEGDYTYPGVPGEVFQRHDHCKCTVDYDGKKLKAYESGGKAHTFRDPDEERQTSGSSGSGRNAKDRKDWHGYKTKEEYVNRFVKQGENIKQAEFIDKMGQPVNEILKRPNGEESEIKVYKNDLYPNIYAQTYSRNSQKMCEYVDGKVNGGEYGDINRIIVAKNKDLGFIAGYDYEKKQFFISEELVNPDKFKEIVGERVFAAKDLDGIINHELVGHKGHWDAVYKYYNDNADRFPDVQSAKNELEQPLFDYIKRVQQQEPRYITDTVSQNAYRGFNNNTGDNLLNELIADYKVKELEVKSKDAALSELIDGVWGYDGKSG